MGTKLPRKLEQKMEIVGEQIKLARLRRNLSVAQVAERATPFTPHGITHRKGSAYRCHRYLSSCALCSATG